MKRLLLLAVSATGILFIFQALHVQDVVAGLRGLDATMVVAALGFILLNNVLAVVRFGSLLHGFGYPPAVRPLVHAFAIGQISNLFLLNIVGQSLSRAAIMARTGIPFGVSVAATVAERLQAMALLGGAALASLLVLFRTIGFSLPDGGGYLLSLLGGAAAALAAVAVVTLRGVVHPGDLPRHLRRALALWPGVVLTLAAHVAMLGAYVCLLTGLGIEPGSPRIVAALVVVMFCASLPISFAGWGLRELGAAQALGAVGVDPVVAVAMAVAVGLLSLACSAAFAGLGTVLLLGDRRAGGLASDPPPPDERAGRWGRGTAGLTAVLTAALLFFQVRVPLAAGEVTVNMADVLALIGLGLFAHAAWERRSLAVLPGPVLAGLAILSALVLAGLLNGALRFGSNEWATVNRGLGWLVVLGYVAVGAAMVREAGEAGRLRILRAVVAAGTVVAGLQILLLGLVAAGAALPDGAVFVPLRGYAQNGNAFAMQMTVVLVLAIATRRLGGFGDRTAAFAAVVALTTTAIYLSTSRAFAAIGAGVLVAALATARPEARRTEAVAVGAAVAAVLLVVALPHVDRLLPVHSVAAVESLAGSGNRAFTVYQAPRVVAPSSDAERWQTIVDGLAIWRAHPVLGGGIGAYVEARTAAGAPIQVIHAVPVWLLAETGLAGAATGAAVLAAWTLAALRLRRAAPTAGVGFGLLAVLATFVAAGLVHDMAYQRIFWFALGLLAAVAGGGRISAPGGAGPVPDASVPVPTGSGFRGR